MTKRLKYAIIYLNILNFLILDAKILLITVKCGVITMSIFADFLKQESHDLGNEIIGMERLIYNEPAMACVKARKLIEMVLNSVIEIEGLELYNYKNLNEKIRAFDGDGIFDKKIARDLDQIRLKGNRASHDSDSIIRIQDALASHASVYKVTRWYFESYLDHKKVFPEYNEPNNNSESDIKELIKKEIERINASNNEYASTIDTTEITNIEPEESTYKISEDLAEGQSYLIREVNKLKESSKEAVENAKHFNDFKRYLHVQREIEVKLKGILEQGQNKNKHLVILGGSVGDGKSHLIAYLNNNSDLLSDYVIINDATESMDPELNAIDTLKEKLSAFSNKGEINDHRKVVLAINLGLLHNFISDESVQADFSELVNFIERSELFEEGIIDVIEEQYLSLVNFGNHLPYDFNEDGIESTFYTDLLDKITDGVPSNPFNQANLLDQKNNNANRVVHYNFAILRDKEVKNKIVNLVLRAIIKYKVVISARSFLNFISDMLLTEATMDNNNEINNLENLLPNILFSSNDRSILLNALCKFDPVGQRSNETDQLLLKFNTRENWQEVRKNTLNNSSVNSLIEPFEIDPVNLTDYTAALYIKTVLRTMYLFGKVKVEEDACFEQFTKEMYLYNKNDRDTEKNLNKLLQDAIKKINGTDTDGVYYLENSNNKYKIAQSLSLKPKTVRENKNSSNNIFYLGFGKDNDIKSLEVDYQLYRFLNRVVDGYQPNKRDEDSLVKFNDFVDQVMSYGEKKEEIFIVNQLDQSKFILRTTGFDDEIEFIKES